VKEGTIINSLYKEEILMRTRKEKGKKMNACYPFKIA
jgi:hypothetical protein